MPLPAGWDQFVKDYKADGRFQFFPHASSIGSDRLIEAVRILATFDGETWNDSDVMSALRKAKVTTGTTAIARVIRRALENLGFCWFDDHVLWMTPTGKAFLSQSADRAAMMEKLLWSYHLDNPVNDGAVGFDLFPHAALIEVLLALPDHRLTRDEFVLFVGRCRTIQALPDVIKLITEWRKLAPDQQDTVIDAVGDEFESRVTDTSYALAFHGNASYLGRFRDNRGRKGIALIAGSEQHLSERLAAHRAGAVAIDFAQPADFIAFHGDPEAEFDPMANVEYLLDTSQWTKALAAFKKLPPTLRCGKTEAEFEREVFLEKDLEDYLVKHPQLIEPGLKLVERQHRIEVGAIDMLCLAANGDQVVVELKKVRASDKVFGQICRYIGCIRTHHAKDGKPVRGYIIGSAIDEKLHYAASVAPKGTVELKTFRRDPANAAIFIEG
jgi:hypothetical protein